MYGTIASCGLDCAGCPAHLATLAGDMEKLGEVAARWSSQSGFRVSAEDIICDGCESESGRINTFCTVCRVRECSSKKGHPTCGHCPEYPCDTLRENPAYTDEARANLERIRETPGGG